VEGFPDGPADVLKWLSARGDASRDPGQMQAFYVSLPVVDPAWTDAESARRGVPPFFYHTHFFVIAEVSRDVYTLVAGFKSHYRVIDWMRRTNSPSVLAGGRLFGRGALEAVFRDLRDFDTDIRTAWTPRINRIHHALFGTNKVSLGGVEWVDWFDWL
jgi:hypothetical protein